MVAYVSGRWLFQSILRHETVYTPFGFMNPQYQVRPIMYWRTKIRAGRLKYFTKAILLKWKVTILC